MFRSLKVLTILVLVGLLVIVGSACNPMGSGETGPAGNGISEIVDNNNGTFTFYFTDGTSFTTSNLRGSTGLKGDQGDTGSQGPAGDQGIPGTNGEDGVGIAEVLLDTVTGILTFNFSDGTSSNTTSVIGEQGNPGIGIDTITDNQDGTFTFNLSDGKTYTTSNLKGPQGDPGVQGPQGDQGPQGIPGENGDSFVVAMGCVLEQNPGGPGGSPYLMWGYNVDSVIWANYSYSVSLTEISYNQMDYITVVTPFSPTRAMSGSACAVGNNLDISMAYARWNGVDAVEYSPTLGSFQFVVYKNPA